MDDVDNNRSNTAAESRCSRSNAISATCGSNNAPPGLQDMPERAIQIILKQMRFAVVKNVNKHPLKNSENVQRNCRHVFARPAFNLAMTCKRFYRIYRNCCLSPTIFDGGYLFQAECQQQHCLTPLLNNVLAIHIGSRNFAVSFSDVALYYRELPYGCEHAKPGKDLSSSGELQVRVTAKIPDDQLIAFVRGWKRLSKLTRLVVRECPYTPRDLLWKTISNACHGTLKEVVVMDNFCNFTAQSMHELGRMRGLTRLLVNSPVIGDIDSLSNMSELLSLNLRGCNIDDNALEPILRTLKKLLRLDVRDTYTTPYMTRALPRSIECLKAGEESRCAEGRLGGSTALEYRAILLSPTSTITTTDINGLPQVFETRKETSGIQFVAHDKFPDLQSLQWGYFESCSQETSSLNSVIFGLKSLTICGPDYNDDLAKVINSSACRENLRKIRVLGCRCSDLTAVAISRLEYIAIVEVQNCLISTRGIYAIADGASAKAGILSDIYVTSDGVSRTPETVKQQLLSRRNRT